MPEVIGSWQFAHALYKEGLLPNECVTAELVMRVDDVLQLRYVVNVLPDDMAKIQRAIGKVYGPKA